MNTRLPLAIALTSAMAFAVGCADRNAEDRTAMQPVDQTPADTIPPAGTAANDPMVNDPAAQDSLYSADAAQDGMLDRESDQPVNDTWITTKVKSSLLADSDVSGLDINVETVNGVVTLSGDVEQQSQVEHATRIAREIEGVTDVNNTALVAR
ncbi:BON domain-containing protein [Luteimonas aestuarii]|nr:BON domain-containing protein [Luteimonas aestuarii]